MKLNDKLSQLAEFHGHLGPYLVIGMRMGELSNEILGKESGAGSGKTKKHVLVKTGTNPPLSCIIDGIQFTSGCTLGKGNIQVTDQHIPEAIFTLNQKELRITLKITIETRNRDLYDIAMEICKKKPEDLFEISKNF